MIKVLIADDQELIRQSLKIVLSTHEDIEVLATANHGAEVMDFLKRDRPDIILMDIRMPGIDGVYCTKLVKEKFPDIKVIILTTFDDDEFVFSALQYGASGYLLKGVSMQELYRAIKTVYLGGAMINPDIASKVVTYIGQIAKQESIIPVDENAVASLTKPEWKVIHQIELGLSNKEIAKKIYLCEGTVRNYLSSILAKLHLRDRTQLAIWAVQKRHMAKGMQDE